MTKEQARDIAELRDLISPINGVHDQTQRTRAMKILAGHSGQDQTRHAIERIIKLLELETKVQEMA